MEHLDIRVLGTLDLRLDGRRLDLGTRKQRALITLLIINRGRSVSADTIVAALWGPDAPMDRRKDVWVYVSRLRKTLASNGEGMGENGEVLRRTEGGYLLDVTETSVDASRFEALVEEGRSLITTDPAGGSLVLGEALALWEGDAYAEFAIEDFAIPAATRLEELRLLATELRIQADLSWRKPGSLIPELEGLVAAHPLRPQFTRLLMVCLYRRGRQAEALRTYRQFADRIGEAGLEPPEELRLLEEQVLMDDVPQRPVEASSIARIPEPIASFVGRDAELSSMAALLSSHRLVTITGMGGVGKTALATEVVRRLAVEFDTAAMVDLAVVEPPGSVVAAIAGALGVDSAGRDSIEPVLKSLDGRRVILILDNCEHVAAQAGEAAVSLLRGAAELHIIATSRVVLDVPGEQIVRLEPLSTAVGAAAEELLGERIAAVGAGVLETVDEASLHAIAELTAGLPLAIELAAAQLRVWSAADVIAALGDPQYRLAVPNRVGPERHRELEANIAWSERLLSPQSSILLRRLAAFRSSFSRTAAEAVAGFGSISEQVAVEVRHLVDASLVVMRPGRTVRYTMLEPVRQYAAARLDEAGEASVVAERHAGFYLDQVETLSPRVDLGLDPEALELARQDDVNHRAALRWTIEAGDVTAAQRAGALLVPLWREVGNLADSVSEFDAVLALSAVPSRERAELVFMAAPLFWLARDTSAWRAQLADLDSMAVELDDPIVSAWAALRRADAAMTDGAETAEVIGLYRRAASQLRKIDPSRAPKALHQLSWYLFWEWDRWDELETTISEWRSIARELGAAGYMAAIHTLESWVMLAQRDFVRLEENGRDAADAYRRMGDHRSAAIENFPLAIGSLWQGDAGRARRRIEVAVAAALEAGTTSIAVNTLLTRACIEVAQGDRAAAKATLRSVLETAGQPEPALVGEMARVAARLMQGSDDRVAAVLLGGHELSVRGLNDVVRRLAVPALDAVAGDLELKLRTALGDDEFGEARVEGAGLSAPEVFSVLAGVLGA